MRLKVKLVVAVILAVSAAFPARSDVIDEWTTIKVPPAPQLKEVTLDPKTTALLMLDFMKQNCGQRPRCMATLPAMKALLAKARAAKAHVVYSIIANSTIEDVLPDVAAQAGEPSVLSGPDKFRNTELEKILKDKGVTTVITVGTSANGAVLFTASGAVFRGMKAVLPVDGIGSVESYADRSTVETFMSAPTVSQNTTITRSTMIKFQ
ncbi:MAG: isochorismatase family protein [Pseudolabrys sp.]|nr:isochorismatase family protein [Pseudolabrys sp.]MBV9956127.1 isochorismatase family protein [Pseudolabrys sp.]